MADSTLYDTTIQTEGTLALAHEKILRVKRNGVFENITGDANNISGVPTKITVQRENYGNKGRNSERKIGDNWVLSWDAEAVRDNTGAIAQAWLVWLLNIAKATGEGNIAEFQLFDAKDPALGAIEGSFTIEVADLKTGFADSGGYKFTATSDGIVRDIVSPIAGDGKPVLESALPAGLTTGDQLVVKGYNLTDTTGLTIKAVSVPEFIVIDSNTLVAVIPAAVSGSSPIIVTNPVGASTALPYAAL